MHATDIDTPTNDPDQVRELSVDQALLVAIELHRLRERDNAELLYRRILEVAPSHPDALHFLGVLLHQRGRSAQAIDLIRKSIALDPAPADRHNNLGNVLLELGPARPRPPTPTARRSRCAPGHADACNNLGAVAARAGPAPRRRRAYQKAIDLRSEARRTRYNNFGNLLCRHRRRSRGAGLLLQGDHADAQPPAGAQAARHRLLHARAERRGRAGVRRMAARTSPTTRSPSTCSPHARASSVPARASDAYVEATFDSFRRQLRRQAGHARLPRAAAGRRGTARACGEPAAQRSAILDAGCGTGLCGPLLAPYAAAWPASTCPRHARTRRESRRLRRAGQGRADGLPGAQPASIRRRSSRPTRWSISARSEPCARRRAPRLAARRTADLHGRSGRRRGAATGYRINPHGRYSHAGVCAARRWQHAGFRIDAMEAGRPAQEGGSPVAGWW